MAPALILVIKRKTRVFPYFIKVYELFTTTLLILLATATWIKNLLCLAPLGFTKSLFFLLFFIWLHVISLGLYGKLYLKLI
jgi:FtsH-binding integral membrane protein